jgi:two-component system, OmpR family, sensor histidine kinase QseC
MKPSLLRDLLAWTLTALVLVWASFLLVGLRTGVHEADELTDGHLASVAALLLSERGGRFDDRPVGAIVPPGLKRHDYQQSMNVVVWRADGSVLTRTGGGPLPPFSEREGFAELRLGDPPSRWRAFSRWDGPQHERRITVMLSVQERDELAWDIAEQLAEPGLWLMPVIALVLGLAIRRGLTPLYLLSNEVHQLDVARGEPLPPRQWHAEFDAVVQAINMLVERQRAVLARERQLASEFAHELRTPLAALALHARTLRGEVSVKEREHAAQRLEHDALRAGEVLSHLLQLARASRAEMAEAAEPFDLAELARRVVAEYAQAALDSGHELALEGDGPLPLTGHRVLMEVALRNLLDNAIGHTAAGTLVEVQLDAQARWLQVCDDGGKDAAAPRRGDAAPGTDSGTTLGLGLGHRVVEKIATLHHARFGPAAPPEGFSSCYRLSFPVPD